MDMYRFTSRRSDRYSSYRSAPYRSVSHCQSLTVLVILTVSVILTAGVILTVSGIVAAIVTSHGIVQ